MGKKTDNKNEPGLNLLHLREKIDSLDTKILSLINERIEMGKQVGTIKKHTGSKILDATLGACYGIFCHIN